MKLVTWNEITVNPNKKIHVNTEHFWTTNWEWTFTETEFSDGNGLYIWLLDNSIVPTTPFDFQITEKTEAEVNALLNTWYSWDVTVSNFVFTDSRVLDI